MKFIEAALESSGKGAWSDCRIDIFRMAIAISPAISLPVSPQSRIYFQRRVAVRRPTIPSARI
jgi:hypothetical protein